MIGRITLILFIKGIEMLTNDEANNRQYRFLNNLTNCAWLTGYIYQLSQDRKSFYIRQSDYASAIFLVELDKNDYLPQGYQEGSGIKIFTRVFSQTRSGHRTIVLRALNIQQPSISELPKPSVDATESLESSGFSFYKEFNLEKPYGKPINNVSLAGFLDSLVFDKNAKGERKSDCLLLDLRVGADVIIPVRVYGKRCQVIYDSIKKLSNRGKYYPIVFNCQLRSKLLEVDDGGDPLVQTYLHSNTVTFMDESTINNYFQGKPLWLHKVIEAESKE